MREIILIVHNVRSIYNVGALLRTAEGLGVEVYLTGYTPYPAITNDPRLPHISTKISRQITKTSLGAEKTLHFSQSNNVTEVVRRLKSKGFTVAALEQTAEAIDLHRYQPPDKLALIVGREVEGIEPEVLKKADVVLAIPMSGEKESFNVSAAAAMALYHLKFAK